jgi:hypothetical protein
MTKLQWRHGPLAALIVAGALPVVGAPAAPPAKAGRSYAQELVEATVANHPELRGLEIAVVTDKGCATVAATSPEDIGEKCDADETGPMKTGTPVVEEPSKKDPVYDITQALHDAAGTLIGAVGMDLAPQPGADRAAMLALAQAIRRELEPKIASKQRLLEAASGG